MTKERITVLLVDDDEITNYLSKEILQLYFENATIEVALNGEEAMEYLYTQASQSARLPDIMLVDINMPYMDGWEFLQKLETDDQHDFSGINIFMYTSSVYFEDINRGKSHKLLKNILTKPLTQEGLQEMGSAVVSV